MSKRQGAIGPEDSGFVVKSDDDNNDSEGLELGLGGDLNPVLFEFGRDERVDTQDRVLGNPAPIPVSSEELYNEAVQPSSQGPDLELQSARSPTEDFIRQYRLASATLESSKLSGSQLPSMVETEAYSQGHSKLKMETATTTTEEEETWSRSSKGTVGKKKKRQQSDDEWLKKRRAQVARASKTAREKRKREMIGLKMENKRLREERIQFLSKIQELQAKVEMLREQGSIDLQLENELLKAQLEEHKKFVGGFMKLASGVPTSQVAKQKLYKQGSDFAIAHVLGLVSQSIKESWDAAKLPQGGADFEGLEARVSVTYKFVDDFRNNSRASEPFPTVKTDDQPCRSIEPNGLMDYPSSSSSSSTSRKRLNVRINFSIQNSDSEAAVALYWGIWTNANEQAAVYGLKDSSSFEFRQLLMDRIDANTQAIPDGPNAMSISTSSVVSADDVSSSPKHGDVISAAYYREKYPPPQKHKDWVFVSIKRKQDMPLSTLACSGDDPSQNSSSERIPCTVMARSTTQHLKAPNSDNTQRITSLFVEGALVWKNPEQLNTTELIVVLSVPDDIRLRELNGFESILDSQGTLTEKFTCYMEKYGRLLKAKSDSTTKAASP